MQWKVRLIRRGVEMMRELKEIKNDIAIVLQHIEESNGRESDLLVVVEEMGDLLGKVQTFVHGSTSETATALKDRDKWQSKYYENLERRDDMAGMLTIEDHKDILTDCIRACVADYS
jgi:hypothetical protein